MPDESDIFSPGMSDRDLAARLIRMGVIPPMNLDLVDSEKIEEITSDLPTVYACRYTVTDMQGQELKLDCYDLEPEGLNRQFLQELSGHKFNSFPERHVLPEYSPDAWKGFLLRDFSGIDRNPSPCQTEKAEQHKRKYPHLFQRIESQVSSLSSGIISHFESCISMHEFMGADRYDHKYSDCEK